ncbi:MAG: iron-sulfur cluster assembly scaffold protein [Candidatus Nealsonbacteria bacterium]|nr:iron-sulfur cluster assembly scaffold protein [Candidatus Nealsonbacteria bacterium]
MDSIYKEIILEYYKNPKNYGRIKKPTSSAFLANPLCGDKIRIDVILKKGKVREIKFSGDGCAISQASASLLTEYSKQKKATILKKIGPKKVLQMLGIKIGPARLKCALLPLEVFKKAISKTP